MKRTQALLPLKGPPTHPCATQPPHRRATQAPPPSSAREPRPCCSYPYRRITHSGTTILAIPLTP
ncbi:hypothetical protein L484_007593 [Morus notabilis]|uniref:Uncharacterized protein n=1 Tax=Morus notabilis TaxID=981085 RepID=W9S8B8_9ROSA|nr:hypothetical protein L484_007593 [Morus notabilis]